MIVSLHKPGGSGGKWLLYNGGTVVAAIEPDDRLRAMLPDPERAALFVAEERADGWRVIGPAFMDTPSRSKH